jgi:predicted unusual protein kinase regulating ubiquinone biosynthesis (AarF/ABC1/UbiB family)
MSREPPKGARRALRLAGLTARVAGSVASTQLRRMFLGEERAEAARRATLEGLGEGIAATLGELKGAVMKVGQMASIAQDLFPAEIQQALRRLQREAPPIPFDVIARQLVAELGRPLADCFDDIDPTPFAAASIGQVHRARIGSRELVVKVQYPGVAQSVESDVAHLRRTLALVTLANIPRSALDAVTAEVAARLREELDYTAEAANARFFAGALADDPRVVVPSVVDDRSSAGVLTLTHEPGIPLGDLSEAQLPAERIDEHGSSWSFGRSTPTPTRPTSRREPTDASSSTTSAA